MFITSIKEIGKQEEGRCFSQFSILHVLVLIVPLEDNKLDVLGLPYQGLTKHVDVRKSASHQDTECIHAGFPVHHPNGLNHVKHFWGLPVGGSVKNGQVAAWK